MQSISEILKDRLDASRNNLLEKKFFFEAKEYKKKRADAIKFFQIKINKERKIPLSFIVIKQKLDGIREIDDLRWFYKECLKYERKKKENTFSKLFWGALKIK